MIDRLCFLLLPALGTVLLSAGAYAQTADAERLRQIEERRREVQEKAEALRQQAAEADKALGALNAQLVDIAEKLQADERELTRIEATLDRLGDEEAQALTDLDAKQRALSDVLAALQSLQRAQPPALAVSPDDASRAAMAAVALSGITPELQTKAQALRADLARIEQLQNEQAAERGALLIAEASLTERRRLLQDLLSERRASQQEDQAELRRVEEEDRRLAREATTLRELIAGIERREKRAVPVPVPTPRALAATPDVYARLPARFSDAKALLPLPAAGRIDASYGDEIGGEELRGLRIRTRPGAVVTAPFRGRVVWAEPFGRLGNVVILDVGEGYRLVLIGLSRLDVRSGDGVGAGEPLGVMSTQSGPTLRLQVRRNTVPVDPAPWMRPQAIASRGT